MGTQRFSANDVARAERTGRGCWYLFITYACVDCGREVKYRERQWDTMKPRDPAARHLHFEQLCVMCALGLQ